MIDDSELFHGTYDPVKAREYYLRTRKLKGRKPAASNTTMSKAEFKRKATGNEGTYARPGTANRSKTKSRQAELRAQKEALEKRLERLREVLAELVEAAKKRSGGNPNKDEKDAAPETTVDKADRNKAEKDATPLTTKQKADKAQKAKEAYEKEHPNSLSTDVDILKVQVKDIQSKIQAALKSAQERRNTAGKNDSKSGSKTNNDGPRGR